MCEIGTIIHSTFPDSSSRAPSNLNTCEPIIASRTWHIRVAMTGIAE